MADYRNEAVGRGNAAVDLQNAAVGLGNAAVNFRNETVENDIIRA